MARIGDEIRAHFLDAVQRREVVKHQHDEAGAFAGERADMRHEPAVDRYALGEFHAARLVGGDDVAHRLDHFGHAQRQRGLRTERERGRDGARCRVERDDPAATVQHDRGIGQARDHRVEKLRIAAGGIVDLLRVAGAAAAAKKPAKQRLKRVHVLRFSSILSHTSLAISGPPTFFTARMPVGDVTLISVR